MNERENLHIRDSDGLSPELIGVAQLIRKALVAELPSDVRRRHEVLLRSLAAAPHPHAPGTIQQTGGVVALPSHRRRAWRSATVLAAVLVLVLGTSAISFANDARPGDRLYGLDRAMERVELFRAGQAESRAETHLRHAGERIREAQSLASDGRSDHVETAASAGARSLEAALEESGGSRDPAAVRAHVLSQMARHLDVLSEVRDRLASTRADDNTLRALDRVIDRATARYAGFRSGDRPGRGGPPADAPRDHDQDRPGPAVPPGTNAKPDRVSGPSERSQTGAGRTGGGGEAGDRGVGPPAERPGANPRP